ncbi:MAG: methyltransferase family protein [Eubacteriales bacterium]
MLIYGSYIVSAVCLWILLSAIVINFYLSKNNPVKKEKKSIVETGSMLAFYILMMLLVYKKVGIFGIDLIASMYVSAAGTILIMIGTAINITGRFTLKDNWGNQIRIYENHTLTTTGIYKHIRHPLYASTILMLYGFSFLFFNIAVFALTTVVFIPFMIFRANQEDKMLADVFNGAFEEYKKKTGMFFPKMNRHGKIN